MSKRWMLNVYCPCCGGEVISKFWPSDTIGPGQFRWKCPDCETVFSVSIQFSEVEP